MLLITSYIVLCSSLIGIVNWGMLKPYKLGINTKKLAYLIRNDESASDHDFWTLRCGHSGLENTHAVLEVRLRAPF